MPRTSNESTGQRPTRTATGRERGDRPQVGTAGSRDYASIPGGLPQYQYTTRPIPYWWYSAYAPGFGFTGYDPWSWGFGSDLWWYRPYGYQPYYPYGFGLSTFSYGGSGGGWSDDRDDRPTGSIRLRVNPRDAKVYVDGALVGVVDEFDGLTNHLDLDPGRHQIEVRATGYESFVTEVTVTDGRTTTTRAKLKKTKP